jgi:hypothetical protein
MAQRLIERFNIDKLLLTTQAQQAEAPEDVTVVEESVYEFAGPRVLSWALNLVSSLGGVNGCKVWYRTGRGGNGSLAGAGRPADLAAIRYMMSYLCNEVNRLADRAAREQRSFTGSASKSWTNSFKLGAVSTIGMRLEEAHRQAREEAKSPELAYKAAIECGDTERVLELDNAPKYELAVIHSALAKLDDRKKRADEWANKQYKFRSGVSRPGAKSYDAFGKGREAGKSVNLSSNKRLT